MKIIMIAIEGSEAELRDQGVVIDHQPPPILVKPKSRRSYSRIFWVILYFCTVAWMLS